jgi:hypothetical protein
MAGIAESVLIMKRKNSSQNSNECKGEREPATRDGYAG